MTLFVDDDYTWLSLMLRPECERRNIPLETSDLNSRGWGDTLFITDTGTYSGEIKSGGELLGGMDHCEAQLQKQLANADRCFLAVYGKVEATEDGNSYALEFNGADRLHYTHGPDSGISRAYKRRHFRTNYLGYRTWLARLVSLGVDVYELPSKEALATQLVGMYNVLTTEGSTLRRVIVEKPHVSEQDPAKARFMRQLMGLEAGIGEELAEAIARCLEELNFDWTVTGLRYIWESGDYDFRNEYKTPICEAIERQMLSSGKRRVGDAAVKRLREALGL